MDISKAVLVSKYDTHSGNGDGVSCIVYDTQNTDILHQISNNDKWNPLPADNITHSLLWGISDTTGQKGPFICDKSGSALIEYITNGYYILQDRQTDNNELTARNSFNCIIILYDTDKQLLYYCTLDT